MNRLLIGGAAAALVVAVAPALAQPAPSTPPGVAQGTMPPPVAQGTPGTPRTRMMIHSNKTLTRGEVAGHVRDMFARLDANRDGFLTREEIDSVRHKFMSGADGDIEKRLAERGIRLPDRGAMFDRLDANHDGNVSRQEYMAAQPQVREQRVFVTHDGAAPGTPGAPGAPGMRMRMHGKGMGMGFGGRLFERADSNKDGRVSLAEAQAAALAHFDRADTNHDGRITPEERQQIHTMRFERRSS